MPRGQPDFGMYAVETYVAGMSDMAELAVRLGSINIFDRRGKVIMLDDFESAPLKWLKDNRAGGTVVFDSTYPKSGSQDIKLSVADAAGSMAAIIKGFCPLLSNRIGTEISFTYPDTNCYLRLLLLKDDGTISYSGEVRININAGTLEYLEGDTDYETFATGLSIAIGEFIYHPIKLVVDFSTGKYVRCIYADVEYDLSAIALASAGTALTPRIYTRFLYSHRVQAVASIYLDDYILTMDEP